MLKQFIKTKKFLCSIALITCFIIGYFLGKVDLGKITSKIAFINLGDLFSPILSFTPLPNFLSDVAAFEGVVIALVIPLSFEIVSRISERYHSEVITKQFFGEWEIRLLPIFLLINILLAISLRFFVQSNPTDIVWKISAWIIFIFYLLIAIILFRFIVKLKSYMIDFEAVLERLYDEAEKYLKQ